MEQAKNIFRRTYFVSSAARYLPPLSFQKILSALDEYGKSPLAALVGERGSSAPEEKKVSLPLLPRACLSPPSLSPVSVPPPPSPPKWRPFSSFPGGSGEGEATKAAFFGAMAASQIAAACSVAAPRVEGTERRGEASPPAGGGRKRPRSFSPICSANSVVSSSPVSMEHLIHFLCPLIIRTNATVAPSPLLFGFRTRPFD